MGEKYLDNHRFYIENDNGERIELDFRSIEVAELDVNPMSDDNPFCYNGFSGITVTLKPQVVSRKRIMKLLMAQGIQRNGASELADYICQRYGFYNPLALLTIL